MSGDFSLNGKTVVIATMHGKGAAIEPALAGLGLTFLSPPQIDTDRFGTFTRDIARPGNQREALLAKARAGLQACPAADFAIASEGAFGPHPQAPFLQSGLEMAGLLERASGKFVIGHHLTTQTNFIQAEVASMAEADAFAEAIGFPAHALVMMQGPQGPIIAKGIASRTELEALCRRHFTAWGRLWLEADMRAHLNPTRMAAVALAAEDLARRLMARCPACGHPDWTPRIADGRPCAWCNSPTVERWIEHRLCAECGHAEDTVIDPGRKAEPGHCSHCNP